MENLKVAIGSDHGGFRYKENIIDYLKSRNIEYIDVGTHTPESCDYPEIARNVAEKVISGQVNRGILVCGTGIGMSLAANKVKGIRAACCSEHFSAKYTRLHNDSNILCLGGRVIGVGTAIELVDLFVDTEFEGGRHQTRVDKITAIENK